MSIVLPRRSAVALLAFSLLAACDQGQPLVPDPAPVAPVNVAAIRCTASVRAGTLTCATPTPEPGGASGALLVGGQGTYVFMEGTNVSYVGTTWSTDVTVQNLIPQALGTTDGVNPHVDGVMVWFDTEPVVTDGDGGGPVTIINHTGEATFTEDGQKFYRYPGILSQDETSSELNWQFDVPADVSGFTFVVYVAAEVQYPDGWVDVTPAADSLLAGGSQVLSATVRTAVGNPVPGASVTWGTSGAGIATVDASGNVTGVAPGTATITATSGARTGAATIAVCANLALGGVHAFDMPAGSSLCLGGGASGSEFTVVPVNLSEAGSTSLAVTGAGIVAVSGPPSPALLPGRLLAARAGRETRLQPDLAWESRLRRQERALFDGTRRFEATRRMGQRRGGGGRYAITPGVPAVGALMNLNVETDFSCSNPDTRTGRVMAVGTHVIVIADTMNPSGGLSAADYQAIADSFDNFIHPVVTDNFGFPSDIDGNGRVIAFYTRAVNELTPPGSSSFTGGFVFSRDLLAAADCPTSNVGEMFYMLAADPAGTVNGNARSVAFIMNQTFGTLGHEFQHLINSSRRMHVNAPWNGLLEEVWLNEGLSHIAEELLFYEATAPSPSPLAPGMNIGLAGISDGGVKQDAFFTYAARNFGRLRQWLLNPHASGGFQNDDDLATRGAVWAFLRYAADRAGGSRAVLWSAFIDTDENGLENVQAVIGTDPLPWYRDFVAAMYADDAAGTPAAAYTQPSWNFRSLYAALDYTGDGVGDGYPLAPRNPANGVADNFTLAPGGAAAYLRMGVAANAFAGVTVLSGGATPPATIRVLVVRRE